jgi:hypothetical protein
MDTTNEAFFTAAFGKDLAKSTLISAATMVGMLGGVIAIGYVAEKLENRKLKKSQKTAPTAN